MITRASPSSPSYAGLGFDWQIFSDVAKLGVETTTDILKLRPPAGTQITTTPGGAFQITRTAEGYPTLQTLGQGVSLGTMALIGGLVVVGLMLATRGRS